MKIVKIIARCLWVLVLAFACGFAYVQLIRHENIGTVFAYASEWVKYSLQAFVVAWILALVIVLVEILLGKRVNFFMRAYFYAWFLPFLAFIGMALYFFFAIW